MFMPFPDPPLTYAAAAERYLTGAASRSPPQGSTGSRSPHRPVGGHIGMMHSRLRNPRTVPHLPDPGHKPGAGVNNKKDPVETKLHRSAIRSALPEGESCVCQSNETSSAFPQDAFDTMAAVRGLPYRPYPVDAGQGSSTQSCRRLRGRGARCLALRLARLTHEMRLRHRTAPSIRRVTPQDLSRKEGPPEVCAGQLLRGPLHPNDRATSLPRGV
jgi:hypothetical protein